MKQLSLEDQAMVHRYRYYVMNSPIISDSEYDRLEEEAIKQADSKHPIHNPGSDLEESYSEEIITIAKKL